MGNTGQTRRSTASQCAAALRPYEYFPAPHPLFFFPMCLQVVRQTGSGAAGQSGDPASRAQRGAAGSATTRPHSAAGSLAWAGTCRVKPAENPRDSAAPHRYVVENSLDAVLGCKYSGNNAAAELRWGEIIVSIVFSYVWDALDWLYTTRLLSRHAAPADDTHGRLPLRPHTT